MTAPVRTVAVVGSCITRDNFNSRFNPDYRRWYDVVLSASQTSMIALMSPPVEPEPSDADPLGAYDTWNVRSDLTREFLAGVIEAQPDFVLVDFFGDVHFGALRLDDGRYVTDNRWKLWKTAQYARWVDADRVTRIRPLADTEAYWELWVEAMDRFAELLRTSCPQTRVVLHHGFNTDRAVVGDQPGWRPIRQVAGKLNRFDPKAGNALWARFDAHAQQAYGWGRIDLSNEGYSSDDQHPWGPFWVHYTPDYYHRFLAEMHLQDVAGRVTPEQRALIEQAARTCNEQLARQAVGIERAVAAGRERIDFLEARGILRTALQAVRRGPRPATPVAPPYPDIARAEELIEALVPDLDRGSAEQVRTITGSSHERARAQNERWAPVLAEQRARIEELEGFGAARAVKFALGQRIRETRARWQKRKTEPRVEKESR